MSELGKMRMKCTYKNKYTEIADYLAGDLSEQKRTEFEAHIIECDDCFEKVKLIEQATLLIKTDGKKAFQAKTPITIFGKIKEFFINLATLKFPKLAYISIIMVLVFCVGPLPFYRNEMKDIYSISMGKNPLSGMRTTFTDSNSTMQEKLFEQLLSQGRTYYVQKKYKKALATFNELKTSLNYATTTDSLKKVQTCKLEFCIGVTKAMLWQSQAPDYFEWVQLKAQREPYDTSYLREAHAHLVNALELSREVSKTVMAQQKNSDQDQKYDTTQIRQEPYNRLLNEGMVNTLLTSIQSKINS